MKGYTLIEVLISLSIISLLLGVGVVSYRDLARRQVVVSAARQVAGDLRFLQNDSLAGRKPTGCSGSLNSYNFRVISASPITSYVIEAECAGPPLASIAVKQGQLPTGTYFVALPPVNPVRFKTVGEGTNLNANQSVTLTLGGSGTTHTQTVVIEASGDIK